MSVFGLNRQTVYWAQETTACSSLLMSVLYIQNKPVILTIAYLHFLSSGPLCQTLEIPKQPDAPQLGSQWNLTKWQGPQAQKPELKLEKENTVDKQLFTLTKSFSVYFS